MRYEKKHQRLHWRNIWQQGFTLSISIVPKALVYIEHATRRIIREGIEIEKQLNNLNGQGDI